MMKNYSLSFFEVNGNSQGINCRYVFGLVNVSLEEIDDFTSKFSNKKEMFAYMNHLYLNVNDPVLRGQIIQRYAAGETLSILDSLENPRVLNLNHYNQVFDDDGFFKITYQNGDQNKRMDIMYAPSLSYDELSIKEVFKRAVEDHDVDFLNHIVDKYSEVTKPLQQINMQIIKENIRALKAGYEVDEEALIQAINFFIASELYMIHDYEDFFEAQFLTGNINFFETVIQHGELGPNMESRNKAAIAREMLNRLKKGMSIDNQEFIKLIKAISDDEIYIRFARPKKVVKNYKGERKLAIIISKYKTKQRQERAAYHLTEQSKQPQG